MSQTDTDIPPDYIAGLFDVAGGIDISVAKSDNHLGYRLTPTLRISAPKYKPFFGMLDEFCEQNDISYKIQPRSSSQVFQWRVTRRDSIKRFLEVVQPYLIHQSKKADLLLNCLIPVQDSNSIHKKDMFCKLLKDIELNDPIRRRNKNVKYYFDEFTEQWDLDADEFELDCEHSFERPDSVSDAYLAGIIDGRGRLTPVIHKNEEWDIGYSMNLAVILTKSDNGSPLFDVLEDAFEERGISANINDQNGKLSIRISSLRCLEKTYETVFDYLVIKRIQAEILLDSTIPRVSDGEHKTRSGFIQILDDIHKIRTPRAKGRDPKYTPDYFIEEWNSVDESVLEG